MATRYINKRISRLYSSSNGGTIEQILICGDKVKTPEQVINGGIKALFREKYSGFIKTTDLSNKPELYFLDVNQADAAFIVTLGRKKY